MLDGLFYDDLLRLVASGSDRISLATRAAGQVARGALLPFGIGCLSRDGSR
jgi:hypothetical protein